MRKTFALIALFVAVTAEVSAQDDSVAFISGHWVQEAVGEGVVLKQCHFENKDLFGANQFVSILEISPELRIDVVNAPRETLVKTTSLASEYNAVAAVNGSFFNMRAPYGGATYTRVDGEVTDNNTLKEAKIRSYRANGSIATLNGKAYILKADETSDWENLIFAEDVLTAGPLMLIGGEDVEIDGTAFNTNRHPRSAVGKKADGTVVFIVVDGRRPQSAGVSIFELARIMKWAGCVDALNLDGGGSSTLMAGDKIVNRPSDNGKFDTAGERKVANILIARPVSE